MTRLRDGCRILVIEDELLLAMSIAEVVKACGGEVAGPVSTVRAAFELIEDGIDAALIDYRLQDETTETLAEHLAVLKIPFAFTTGYGPQLLPAGLRGHPVLEKPFTAAQIESMLVQLCKASS